MNSISVKTNTVLICKSLAEAQFRCVDCSKAFISEKYLLKHNLKRHGLPPYSISTVEPVKEDKENEKTLKEAAGRLERAICLLEEKTSSLGSKMLNERPEETVSEVLDVHPKGETLYAPAGNVRKSISLFTLPNDIAGEPIIVDGWMNNSTLDAPLKTEGYESPVGDLALKIGSTENDTPLVKTGAELALNGDCKKYHSYLKDTASSPVDFNEDSNDDVKPDQKQSSIEPLLINLINKLDTVFSGDCSIKHTFSQTTETLVTLDEHPAHPTEDASCQVSGIKSVRFSDSPLYYGSSEQHFAQSESDSCSENSQSKSETKDTICVGEFKTYTNSSAPTHVTRLVYHPNSAADTSNVGDEGIAGRVAESALQDNSGECTFHGSRDRISHDQFQLPENCHEGPESGPEVSDGSGQSCEEKDDSEEYRCQKQQIAEFDSVKPGKTKNPSGIEEDVRSMAEFVATKKQILKMVEKCVEDIRRNRKQPAGSVDGRDEKCSDQEKDSVVAMSAERKDSTCMRSSQAVCIGKGNITADSPGILPPCTVICKDECPDIDELSGDSYERFMKRFYCSVTESKDSNDQVIPPIDDQHDGIPHDSVQLALEGAIEQGRAEPSAFLQDERSAVMVKNDENKQLGLARMKIPTKQADLKKSDYAVLLHHETSEVQSLIDTLVTDLERWRSCRRNRLSHAIRLQMEDRLASSLNLLGVQSNAQALSDSAAATAHFLLKNRRSKAAKATTASFFDVVKYAFLTEVERIAKSRTPQAQV